MIISLVHLPADGLKFEHRYAAGEMDLRDYDFELERPPVVRGRVDRVGFEMRLRGMIEAALKRPCDRCLKEVALPVELPFDLLYTPEDPGGSRTGEIELHERDLDFAVYQNVKSTWTKWCLSNSSWACPRASSAGRIARGCVPSAESTGTSSLAPARRRPIPAGRRSRN